ncbi:UDP-D-xylose:L-fucose alpha-1,3-D-xylosyltransferase MGP4-like isoform X3 [Quercus robur]|uniref:UDP-D-xylose:L-fucose alpha-1,3-D-xylosyltransferase MGP4-like isoform X3 n=1 Tax=Quercus robur TaxID=38942 RepID=UPI0021618893|nr:UDP-D-xylose:L-fucose alpha-1,3-D-xylosyltransferase MGP4-like isoform X3 [Quercus robur]
MSAFFLHQRPIHNPFSGPNPLLYRRSSSSRPFIIMSSIFTPIALLLLSLLIILGVLAGMPDFLFSISSNTSSQSKWRDYTLAQAASFVAKNGTVIVCAVSHPYLPFLNNWLISIARQKHQDKVLVIAEDYATLFKVNQLWPGHAVLVPPAPDSQTAHKFGSQGFFNFTSRRPRHLLHILELGYNVMYNDVDMVWLADPFPYLEGSHDVYFTDDMAAVSTPTLLLAFAVCHLRKIAPSVAWKKGRPYICSCMIFLRPTSGAKLVMKKWIEELQSQPWSKAKKANDQPGFNWALNKTAGEVI